MNILYFIGNGFDLNLGMKTRYSDFYDYYLAINSNSNSVNNLKSNISKTIENWSDLELELGKYTEKIETIEEFDEVFEDIVERLADYLQQVESTFDLSKIDKKKLFDFFTFPENSLLKADTDILHAFKDNWKSSQWNVNVITLNYTTSIEKLIEDKMKGVQIGTHHNVYPIVLQGIEHIHGYTDKRMIMGVNDISQIANTSFHGNQDILEAIVKKDCNQAQKHTIDNICKQHILSANLICIFGSSIGQTDNLWWDLIGNQLKDNCNLIIFDKREKISARMGHLVARRERALRKSFLERIKLTEEEKENISSKIFIAINSDMFNLI